MLNDAETYKNFYEVIGGEKIMAPSASAYHSNSIGEIYFAIKSYLNKNKCGKVFIDSLEVHLPDGNIFRPDLIVMTKENAGLVNWNRGIYGVPDMVVEVLSKATRRMDLTVKKDSYEACGIKEYWIVDPYMKVVDVYLLHDGKYKLDGEYIYYDAEELQELTDEEKAELKNEVKVSIFENCFVKLEDIFSYEF
ncbi:MAG: Uma2 family endonuclease [Selenomonadaceae bacterium]|nr:Uma2 family endonuclease [Selenomonadaceae bacterium]